MASLIVLIGIPGAGKTTYAEFTGLPYESRDAIPYSSERQRAEWLLRLEKHLVAGHDVIADSTGLRRPTRDRLRALADRHGVACVAVLFDDVPTAVERNAQRADPIPDSAMIGLIRNLKETKESIDSEGFTHVIRAHPVLNVERSDSGRWTLDPQELGVVVSNATSD